MTTAALATRVLRAVRGLNRFRGEIYSWPGGDCAEVFTWFRV